MPHRELIANDGLVPLKAFDYGSGQAEVNVRRAVSEDWEAHRDAALLSFPHAADSGTRLYDPILTRSETAWMQDWRRRTVGFRSDWLYLAAETVGHSPQAIGFAAVRAVKDGWGLTELCVNTRKASGIRTVDALLDQVEQEARTQGERGFSLTVVQGDETALDFYAQRGFKVVKDITVLWQTNVGDRALTGMVKRLKPRAAGVAINGNGASPAAAPMFTPITDLEA